MNIASNVMFRADDSNSFPFGPSLLGVCVYVLFFGEIFFLGGELTMLRTHGSRFRMCLQTLSGSSRRHPGILFIKLGFSIIANMQWLES